MSKENSYYLDEDIASAVLTALEEINYSVKKLDGIDGYAMYNNYLKAFEERDGEIEYVHNASELLDALSGMIERYGEKEIYEPLADDEELRMNDRFKSLYNRDPVEAFAYLAEWEHCSDIEEADFYQRHRQALVLFDVMVNEREWLKDPAILDMVYEEQVVALAKESKDKSKAVKERD